MTITDTLDQLLRSLASADEALGAERRAAATTLTAGSGLPLGGAPRDELETLLDEVAAKRAHELDAVPERPFRFETAVGAVESLGLGFHLGAALERIAAGAARGSQGATQLREAAWLLDRYATLLEQRPVAGDLHASSLRLARTRDTLDELHGLRLAPEPSRPPLAVADPAPPAPAPPEPPVAAPPSIGRELAVTAGRGLIFVVGVLLLVLALTLIGERL